MCIFIILKHILCDLAKVLELKQEMGINVQFVASEGWLSRWKKRYDIRQYFVCGEKLSADITGANNFKEQFSSTIREKQLNLCQIFNADETGLNYKMMPKKNSSRAKRQTNGIQTK